MSGQLWLLSGLHSGLCYFYLRWLPGRAFFPLIGTLFILIVTVTLWEIGSKGEEENGTGKRKVVENSTKGGSQSGGGNGNEKGGGSKVGDRVGSRFSKKGVSGNSSAAKGPVSDGRPRNRNPLIKFNFLFQLCCLALAIDFTFTKRIKDRLIGFTFSRVTWVDDNSVHIFTRYPQEGGELLQLEYGIVTEGEEGVEPHWILGPTVVTSPEEDYTKIVRLDNLKPSTTYGYRYKLKTSPSTTTTSSSPISPLPTPIDATTTTSYYKFTTSPIPNSPTTLYFAVGSCIKPDFPYSPFSNKGVRGFQILKPFNFQMLLFLGDFIYSDAPFYFGPSLDSYRQFYRQLYADRYVQPLAESLPIYHAYDDHEILNNWDKQLAPPFENAITAYTEYQGAGPFLTSPGDSDPNQTTVPSYFNMTYGDIGIYFWDTRKYRSPGVMKDGPDKTMLGSEQKLAFKNWIRETKDSLKMRFIVSSVPLTYNWVVTDSVKDTWKGYQYEREELLSFLQDVPNLFFLSGDRHEVAVVNLPHDKLEFSLSPINQFYGPMQLFQTRGLPDFDSTLLYYRHGNTKFGAFYVDTQSRSDGRPLLAVTIYSDLARHYHENFFDPTALPHSIPHSHPHPTTTKVVTNFNFTTEPALTPYLSQYYYPSSSSPSPAVTAIFHLFWLGES